MSIPKFKNFQGWKLAPNLKSEAFFKTYFSCPTNFNKPPVEINWLIDWVTSIEDNPEIERLPIKVSLTW